MCVEGCRGMWRYTEVRGGVRGGVQRCTEGCVEVCGGAQRGAQRCTEVCTEVHRRVCGGAWRWLPLATIHPAGCHYKLCIHFYSPHRPPTQLYSE